jgi:4-hydroxy-3-polyprenylbenzoate decarboxylase
MNDDLVLGVTGASGAVYARRLLDVWTAAGRNVYLTITPSGAEVIRHELGAKIDLDQFDADVLLGADAAANNSRPGEIRYCHYKDFMAPIASGSSLTGGMAICPCSGGTLSAVANGASTNLLHRAADVHLKERRKLIVVPRETPLALSHIDNMRRLVEAGAIVAPASPGFYHGARSVGDLVDFVVARICDQFGVPHRLMQRWGDEA